MIRTILYRFAHSPPHLALLPNHLANILTQDALSPSPKYKLCSQYIARMDCANPTEVKLKGAMLFSAHCLSDAFDNLKPTLSELIINGSIRSQYQLDQLAKWLTREVKVNRAVGRQEIQAKLAKREEEASDFQAELSLLSQQAEGDLNETCKRLREKYMTIDSKAIFEGVSKALGGKVQEERKDNKLWDKLLQVKPRRLKEECNSKEVYEQHLKETGGRPRFRFPPEPNGYLHIGHVKSIRVNFQSARRNNGLCFLRYDDTNPDKETHEFIEEIQRSVKWLGYSPDKVTFASDYFEQLMQFAHRLVQQGHAYVCDSSREEIQAERKAKRPNPYRNRPIEESLKIFPHLEPHQTLRLKWLYDSPNPTLRDPVMYRRKSTPHPRTGSKYSIYPMYDFTHCISDSLQHIDYSLCSLQFQVRRELYYTFLDLLGLYKPTVWEYSRLNIEGNVLSKRKIKQFIEEGVVDGWDDPRLLTIKGLRNRGYTPEMLKEFIDKVNCSRTGNENVVQFSLLEKEMKRALLKDAPKTMAVLDPIPTRILNFQKDTASDSSIRLDSEIVLDRSDVSNLLENHQVILKSAGVFKVLRVKDGVELQQTPVQNVAAFRKSNPQTRIIHWLPLSQSQQLRVVLYDRLLLPTGEPNPHSRTLYETARIPLGLPEASSQYFQFQRVGFFRFSTDRRELRMCAAL